MFENYYINNREIIEKAFDSSEFPNTAKALKRFYSKTYSISNVIQNIDYQSDTYTCYLLIRSLVEHFLVAFYIWIKFHLDKNDRTATIYYEEYLFQELIKKINYTKANKIDPTSRYLKLFSLIYDGLKEKSILKEKHISDLNHKANIFDIRMISRFVNSNIPTDTEIFIKPKRIKEMLELYNYFSTFIHGGPSADLLEFESKDVLYIQTAETFKIWSKNILDIQRFINLYFISYENKEIESSFQKEIERLMEGNI